MFKKTILLLAAVLFMTACSERSNSIFEPSEDLNGIYSRVLLSDYENIILYYSGAYVSDNIEDFGIYPDGQNWRVLHCETLLIEAMVLYCDGLAVELNEWPHISAAR